MGYEVGYAQKKKGQPCSRSDCVEGGRIFKGQLRFKEFISWCHLSCVADSLKKNARKKHPNGKDLLGYKTLSPQDKVRVNDFFGGDQEEEEIRQSNYIIHKWNGIRSIWDASEHEIQEWNERLSIWDASTSFNATVATNHSNAMTPAKAVTNSVYALRYQHDELASCDVRNCNFGHRMMENSLGLVRSFGTGEGTVGRRWMHIQCVPLLQVQLVNQEHPLGRDLPGYLTLIEEERRQVDLTFGWRATDPSPPSPAVAHNAWNEARVDSSSAKSRSRTGREPNEDNHNLASPRSSLTEDCGENNTESCLEDSDLLLSRASFSQAMQQYSEMRVDTAGFLVQMAAGTDTYENFHAALKLPKQRVTPDKRINEAKDLVLELKMKEADVLAAEAELEAAEARLRTEMARLQVVEEKKKMTTMGFEI